MNNISIIFALAATNFLLISGCKDNPNISVNADEVHKAQSSYDLAIHSGIQNWAYPREFNQLFPNAHNGISYYTGIVGKPSWSSSVGLDNRYIPRIVLPMELDENRTSIVSMGIPEKIDLAEFKKPVTNANGSLGYGVKTIATLSPEDWQRLVQAKGDFNVLGIKLETNQPPIEGFEQAWPKF